MDPNFEQACCRSRDLHFQLVVGVIVVVVVVVDSSSDAFPCVDLKMLAPFLLLKVVVLYL